MSFMGTEIAWCAACCTQHEKDDCPGVVELTGPERAGRRFVARREDQTERYQVLVGKAGDRWRARIVTLPNMLWAMPSGRRTAKFIDTDPIEAERKAVLFIFQRARSLGFAITEIAEAQESEPDDTRAGKRTGGRRVDHSLTALFGADRPTWPAKVSNLSVTGLFLATNHPVQPGDRISIVLQCEHFRIPLVGIVSWINPKPTGAVPAGMGVELDDPSAIYRQYVAGLGDDTEGD